MDATSAGGVRELGASGRAGGTLRHDAGRSGPEGSRGRIAEIDSLRGLACLVVIIYHAMPHKVPGGWASVDLAFVLSGFLLTSSLLCDRQSRSSPRSSYLRRGLRVWPLYLLTVLLVAAAAPMLRRPCDVGGLPNLLTYTQNTPLYWSDQVPNPYPYLAHTWALAVEEQFVLVWVPLVFLVGRRGVVPLSLAIVITSVWARARGYHWWLLLSRGDGLALGALLAAVMHHDRVRRPGGLRVAMAAAGSTALLFLVWLASHGGMSTLGMPRWPAPTLLAVNLLACSVVGLVVIHAGHPALWPLRSPHLARVGRVGYELYVFHFIVFMLGDDLAHRLGLRGRPVWRDALTVLVLVALVAAYRRFVHGPARALKDRLGLGPALRPDRGTHRPAAMGDLSGNPPRPRPTSPAGDVRPGETAQDNRRWI